MPRTNAVSGSRQILNECLQPANDGGLSGRGVKCLLGQLHQRIGMEAGGKPFDAHGRDVPIAIAASARQQVNLPRQTGDERFAQFREQQGIIACRCGKCRFKGSGFVGHEKTCSAYKVKSGFICRLGVVSSGMVGENRILAFGGGEQGSGEPEHWDTSALEAEELGEADDVPAWVEAQEEAGYGPAGQPRSLIAPILAALAIASWTGVYAWANQSRFGSEIAAADWIAMVSTWTGPVLLIGLIWLLAMRNSRREAGRFADASRLLAEESARLEARLVTVNRELSLAREFLSAQSRDLESVGRIAADRLSQNADRLQELVRDNGNRIETLGSVSETALDNMEKLRGQLPVIASAAKDVTNNIGNAGRTAHAQLEEMVSGFKRLNDFGKACNQEVSHVRTITSETIAEFEQHCERLQGIAEERFSALNARGAEFRVQLDQHEIDALASIRSRAAALTEELEESREKLDMQEAERLKSLRARLSALREETSAIGRSLRDGEDQAIEAWKANLTAIEEDRSRMAAALREAEDALIESARTRLHEVEGEAERLKVSLDDSHRDFADQLESVRTDARTGNAALLDDLSERLDAIAAQFADQGARLDEDFARRDASLQDRHERTFAALAERFAMLDGEVAERSVAVLAQIEQQQGNIDARHARLIAELSDRVAALDSEIAERMERQDERTQALAREAGRLTLTFEGYERQLGEIAERSQDVQAGIAASLGAIRSDAGEAQELLSGTEGTLSDLTNASMRLLDLVRSSAATSKTELPEALTRSEQRLADMHESISGLRGALEDAADRSEIISGRIDGSGTALQALIAEIDGLYGTLEDRDERQRDAISAMRSALADLDKESEAIARKAQAELTEAIDRLSASVRMAVTDIDETGTAAISSLAAKLGQESAETLDRVMRAKAAEASGQLEQAAAHAAGVGREAAVQLRDQLAKINELVGNLEQRVAHARDRAEEQVDNDFARRAALISESLNSNAIDIAKALSTDVSDTAWASYLRGDRGIFTRRAVSLIETNEARAIQQIFERDPDFREHVSRYIHDFEAILRQVLSTRDGNALGVTLLSSDMGKLYVALAQAIKRLRS